LSCDQTWSPICVSSSLGVVEAGAPDDAGEGAGDVEATGADDVQAARSAASRTRGAKKILFVVKMITPHLEHLYERFAAFASEIEQPFPAWF
jgi:hypothetical protein